MVRYPPTWLHYVSRQASNDMVDQVMTHGTHVVDLTLACHQQDMVVVPHGER